MFKLCKKVDDQTAMLSIVNKELSFRSDFEAIMTKPNNMIEKGSREAERQVGLTKQLLGGSV